MLQNYARRKHSELGDHFGELLDAQDQSVKDRFDGKRSLKATHECLKRTNTLFNKKFASRLS
jgi:hypothetical protein